MTVKVLLTQLSTTRDGKRVKFEAKQAVDLTKAELDTLDRLTASTGRPHYRDPINEKVKGETPAVVDDETDEGADDEGADDGEGKTLDEMTVAELKAYLDEAEVEYDSDAKKADLLKAAKAHETDGGL